MTYEYTPNELNIALGVAVTKAVSMCNPRGSIDPDDVLQVARLEAWTALCRYDPSRGKIATLVMRCVAQRIFNLFRDHAKRPTPQPLPTQHLTYIETPPPTWPDRVACLGSRTQVIYDMLRAGHQKKDIAASLGISAERVRDLIQLEIRPAVLKALENEFTYPDWMDSLVDYAAKRRHTPGTLATNLHCIPGS